MRNEADDAWRVLNRVWWDERAPVHAADGSTYGVERLVAGADHLRRFEDDELGPVEGLDLLHLQCHIGTDTICWARRGADVVGLDFSAPALNAASELAKRCGVDAEWVQSDVYDARESVGGRSFDVVYTGVGALNWLPDLVAWARLVHDLLRPGGVLYLVELHPMWIALGDDGCTLREDAINGKFQAWDIEQDGSYAAPDATFSHQSTWERLHPLGDVLTAVLEAGMTVELFHEWDHTPAPTPWLVECDDGMWRFPETATPFPLLYSLRARRPGGPTPAVQLGET